MNEAFLEKRVGEQMTGEVGKSGAGVLQAAAAQNISLMYVDMEHLEALAKAPISQQAKARIVDAVTQGYAVLVPEQMVSWDGRPAPAWWQLDLKTGEVVDVNEDGTHQWLVQGAFELKYLLSFAFLAFGIAILIDRIHTWQVAANATWQYYWNAKAPGLRGANAEAYRQALIDTKTYMRSTVWPSACSGNVSEKIDCFLIY